MTVTLGLKSGQQWVLGARLQTPQFWWGEGRAPSHPGPACESAEPPQASVPSSRLLPGFILPTVQLPSLVPACRLGRMEGGLPSGPTSPFPDQVVLLPPA